MLADLEATALAKAMAAIDGGSAAEATTTDVSDSSQVRHLMARAVERFGQPIDVLFSNAGNMGVIRPLADFPEDEFDRVLAVHVKGAFQEAAQRNIRVNTIHPGSIANDFQRRVEASLTDVMQRDAGEFFDQIIPLGRHGRPEEVAQSVLYLASDQSSFVTGSLLMVDGGMSA
jgi:NAD(P)-dependent dehydrogenase (short-subunit alcohol dehydrogenase family)